MRGTSESRKEGNDEQHESESEEIIRETGLPTYPNKKENGQLAASVSETTSGYTTELQSNETKHNECVLPRTTNEHYETHESNMAGPALRYT